MKSFTLELSALLALIRSSLWSAAGELPQADWAAVEKLAMDQGVLWMLYPGAKHYPQQIPAEYMRSWRSALHAGVLKNDRINAVQKEMLAWLAQREIPAVILKGTSCARCYPFPEARTLGDIDLLVAPNHLQTVGAYLEAQGFASADKDNVLHASYHRHGVVVEVHRTASSAPDSAGGRIVEEAMSHFLDDIRLAEIADMQFPVLSDANQALMLLLHMERHMILGGIGLRQLCDWAAFVHASDAAHWENASIALLKKCGLFIYAQVITKACVKYLGLDADHAPWCHDAPDALVDDLWEDMMRGGNLGKADAESSSGMFTDRNMLGSKKQSALLGLISALNALTYKHFPAIRHCKILLPFFWIFLPARYMLRSLLGLRPRKNVVNVLAASNTRYELYKKLHLYESE